MGETVHLDRNIELTYSTKFSYDQLQFKRINLHATLFGCRPDLTHKPSDNFEPTCNNQFTHIPYISFLDPVEEVPPATLKSLSRSSETSVGSISTSIC